MPSDKNPCLNKIIKWYQEISQQPSQVRLGECWMKCLGKAHQKNHTTPASSKTYKSHSGFPVCTERVHNWMSQGVFHKEMRSWSDADNPYWLGRRQKVLQKFPDQQFAIWITTTFMVLVRFPWDFYLKVEIGLSASWKPQPKLDRYWICSPKTCKIIYWKAYILRAF